MLAGGNGLPYPDIPKGDHLWAFKLGGKVGPAPAPTPPSSRNQIRTAAVTGATARDTVTLGRVWDSAKGAPGATENLVAQNAMSPQHLTIARRHHRHLHQPRRQHDRPTARWPSSRPSSTPGC